MQNHIRAGELSRLKDAVSQIFRLSEALAPLKEAGADGLFSLYDDWQSGAGDPTLSFARRIYDFRRKRERYFPADLFAEPAWDILLDLYIFRLEGRRATVKSVCIASGVPQTTALRWINLLIEKELLDRTQDEHDSRVRCISLSDNGYHAVRAMLLAALGKSGGAPGDTAQSGARVAAAGGAR
ncbi:MarR family transcriptional regulator [Novosphingobium sp. ERN07]|uniref:winged helix DNA-binding protein n=1 Tax=Novosphingobium sp. ERN07 TaxID=2726187 RepID=UPI0014577845|nr:winged helix DNA-binding protein [Novosphingobium sp. ERN07]NLR72921.1 MarR family transcriptional regulator [Novosphingobium sp. ERN07]